MNLVATKLDDFLGVVFYEMQICLLFSSLTLHVWGMDMKLFSYYFTYKFYIVPLLIILVMCTEITYKQV